MARGLGLWTWSVAALALAAGGLAAATPATTVHKHTQEDQPYPAGYHTVLVRTVIDPGGDVPPHTHPGLEEAYVLTGAAAVTIVGQPPVTLHPGDSIAIPEGRVHSVHNPGRTAVILVSTYVVKAGEPIATPVTPSP